MLYCVRLAALAAFALSPGWCDQALDSTQTPPPAATPAITGPLQAPPPNIIDAEGLRNLVVNGVLSGMGLWQANHVPGDRPTQAALSNAQIFIQKASGWWQFYVQAGAYDLPALATPYISTEKTITDFYGPVPVAYLKLAPAQRTAILVGALPTLLGAESTFTFQNMNVNRGLLWNQENAVNRGIQVNETLGKFSAAFSWNDGFYSDRFSWLSGSLTYAKGSHSLTFSGMGNLAETRFRTSATPVQNNGRIYALIYTYSEGNWIVQPYIQLSSIPTDPKAGVGKGASARGAALLATRRFTRRFALAGRGEYISSTGNRTDGAANLLYGPGSAAWSATLTPTFQWGRFFVRADLSHVRLSRDTPGHAFGPAGVNHNQPRATLEAGFLF